MQRVAIVTDSTADLPQELYKNNKITVVPLSVIFEERTYPDDGISLTNAEFYNKLKEAKKLPTTTQPSPADFKRAYSKLLEDCESILSIHISKKMSGTADSAEIARTELKAGDISVIDSEVTTIALGMIVKKCSEMAMEGAVKTDILPVIDRLKSAIHTLFIPHTLEYLQKGGRIGRARGLIASLLEIKPILTLYQGEVSQYKTTRRWKQAKNEMLESFAGMVKDSKALMVSVADADLKEDGDEIEEEIRKKFNPGLLIRSKIGPIVGTHLGPAVAMAFYEEQVP